MTNMWERETHRRYRDAVLAVAYSAGSRPELLPAPQPLQPCAPYQPSVRYQPSTVRCQPSAQCGSGSPP